ncbi:hypothetical protein OQX63_03790 [Pedobacter sp. PF22-3]|uniref:hypothetical protein n=1 Tax=Pedobacter sp. PF22-3 TaxID=2994467 RepID=UPI0022467C08|nr:hypothetical protein [Pedobacter sp. PF22-3]MCX2492579.1 hypothetical protein [Pedobacter sp. PF22-3]
MAEILDKYNLPVFIYNNGLYKESEYQKFKNVVFYTLPISYPTKPRRPLVYLAKVIWPKIIIKFNSLLFKKNIIIGVDLIGYLIASRSFKYKPELTHYISFELLFKDEMKNNNKFFKLKILEEKFLKMGLKSLLIQDAYRQDLFLKENLGLTIDHTFLLPVAPSPYKSALSSTLTKARKEKIKVIYAGSIYAWSGINEIIDVFEKMNNANFELHIHSRFALNVDHPLVEKISALKNKGIQINMSSKELAFTELYEFLKNFDIGIATYFPVSDPGIYDGLNMQEIGLSSGKFSTYMMLGLPTIVSPTTSFNNLRKKYSFGEIIYGFDGLENSLIKIADHYEAYSNDCKKLYNKELNPDLYIGSYVDNILN